MSKKKVNDVVLHLVPVNLETSVQYVDNSVYIISNGQSKTCLIGSSTNLYLTLGRLLENLKLANGEYKSLSEDLGKVTISILETNIEKEALKLRQSYWIQSYRDKGYKFYKEITPLKYTLSIDLDYKRGRLHYFVSLRNKGNHYKLIAVFKTKKEMNEWIRVHYPDLERIGAIIVNESSLEGISASYKKGSKP